MYAIIQTGGKQYRVESGDVLDVELDARGDGDAIEFRDVLLVSDESGTKIGEPKLENAAVKFRRGLFRPPLQVRLAPLVTSRW